ncbi:MAG: DUF4982 domain-containing protein [Bacteroidia bacterium]|nr:DUF4982 domain-containing protein [Bacteroidia bacterium]
MKRKQFVLLTVVLIFTTSLTAQVSFGKAEKINDGWKFTLNNPDKTESATIADKDWREVVLPHDWSVKGQLSPTLASCIGYLPGGIGWYKKVLQIPQEKTGQKVYLYFEGVYNRSEVFVNGKSVGKRPSGFISFMYDVTPFIQFGIENVIAVRVDHSLSADARWYTGSGIYRDAWLVYGNPVHIAQWGVYAYPKAVTANQATFSVEVELENGSTSNSNLTIQNELVAPDGKMVATNEKKLRLSAAQNGKINVELSLKNPQLWNLKQPNLYTLNTKVIENGKVIDQTSTKTGIRSYTFDPNKGFALNGEWMKVKGVCLHHDAGVLGSAVPREVWRKRLLALKEVGVNAIRTSHNPQAPEVYELCDELGFLVMNEAYDEWIYAKRKWITGWNNGEPGFQGNNDFFKQWGEQDLADMVRRDRNHVSVFAWSIGNEVDYPNDPYSHPILDGTGNETGFTQPIFGGYKKNAPNAMELGDIAKRLVAVVHKYDLSRPVTAGLAGVAMSNETEYPGALDIAGYNYTENRYNSDHEKYPKRVLFGSENRHELSAWKQVRDKEFIFGQFLWTGIDYLGESGEWPSRGFYSGLLDFGGNIKPRGYFRQSIWSDKPMAYIGTYPTPNSDRGDGMKDVWSQLENKKKANKKKEEKPSMDAWPIWNYEQGQSIRVVCYTNAAKAKLVLNGKEVGETKAYDDTIGIIYWDIPYETGILEVIGLDKNGTAISKSTLQSSNRPFALQLKENNISIRKENGLAQIDIQVVDESGTLVMLADNAITCQMMGPARLLGLEGSDNDDMGDYTDTKQRAFHGKLLAYIQATGEVGEVKVKFSTPLLKSVELTIDVK